MKSAHLARPVDDSLGAWAMALTTDSPCFCCGSPLRGPVANPGSEHVPYRLVCTHCGAEVFGRTIPVVLDAAPRALERDLVAA